MSNEKNSKEKSEAPNGEMKYSALNFTTYNKESQKSSPSSQVESLYIKELKSKAGKFFMVCDVKLKDGSYHNAFVNKALTKEQFEQIEKIKRGEQ